jgi:uncharacterized membrane protein YphA (DoxX/SURF4 family)
MINEHEKRYAFSDAQKQSAQAKLHELEQAKDQHFDDPAVQQRVTVYREEVERAEADIDGNPKFVREHAKERLRDIAKSREELLAPIDMWEKALRDHLTNELTPEQIEQTSQERLSGLANWLGLPFQLEWPAKRLDQINIVTMLGLTLCGALLVVGLFSRLAGLGAAAFIGIFYACNPAPPLGTGLPGDPGHYLYVNKELVECIAALVLAVIPTGRWLGLDGLIHGFTRLFAQRITGAPSRSS